MGKYIAKYKVDDKVLWGIKKGDTFLPFINQPNSLKELIENQDNYVSKENVQEPGISINPLQLESPISAPTRIICQGLNYATHRKESALDEKSSGNVMFAKDDSSISGPYQPIMRPKECECLDYEVELGLIIKQDIKTPIELTNDKLHEYVAGLIIANDMSPRDLQYKDDYAQWFKAKSARTMLPLGPCIYLLEKQDFSLLYKMTVKLWVNNELRQSASTSQMIFKPAETISEISTFMNLEVGDLLLTGTPGGVVIKAPSKFIQGIATWLLSNEKKVAALRKHKQNYLQDGDVVKTHIASENGEIDLGFQENTIIPYQY